ncbi:MAG: hypothetical protein CL763_05930 [Chloroflexi bacterium]|nr:hypothetical protein [Chloroflexota bacterium]
MNDNKKKNIVSGKFSDQIAELGGRVASDLGYPAVYDYDMASIIHEHQDRLDLSDYNAVLEFVTDVLDDEIII